MGVLMNIRKYLGPSIFASVIVVVPQIAQAGLTPVVSDPPIHMECYAIDSGYEFVHGGANVWDVLQCYVWTASGNFSDHREIANQRFVPESPLVYSDPLPVDGEDTVNAECDSCAVEGPAVEDPALTDEYTPEESFGAEPASQDE